jgi:hypothetical protein
MSKYHVEHLLSDRGNRRFTAEVADQMILDARRECAEHGMEAMMSVLSAVSYLLLNRLPNNTPFFQAPYEGDLDDTPHEDYIDDESWRGLEC